MTKKNDVVGISYDDRSSLRNLGQLDLDVKNLRRRIFDGENKVNDLKNFLDVLLGVLMKHTDIDQEIAGLLNELLRKGA